MSPGVFLLISDFCFVNVRKGRIQLLLIQGIREGSLTPNKQLPFPMEMLLSSFLVTIFLNIKCLKDLQRLQTINIMYVYFVVLNLCYNSYYV